MSINITVKNRKDEVIADFPKIPKNMTVQDFKKKFLQECERVKKMKLYPARLRFTVSDARGKPLSDT